MLPSMRLRLRAAGAATLAVLLGTAAVGADAIQDFLRRHWRPPLAPQGPPPARFSPLEASLHPEACGTCHSAQFADWRESTHAAAAGPGLEGQLVEMLEGDPRSALGCLTCHAPLAEQSPLVAEGNELRPNPAHDGSLPPRACRAPAATCGATSASARPGVTARSRAASHGRRCLTTGSRARPPSSSPSSAAAATSSRRTGSH